MGDEMEGVLSIDGIWDTGYYQVTIWDVSTTDGSRLSDVGSLTTTMV